MSNIKKLASHTAIYGLSTIAGRFLNYLLVPIYTRIFTTGEYGINAEFYAYISFLNILLTHGMETAFFRYSQENKEKNVFAVAMQSVLGVSTLFILIIAAFGSNIAQMIGYPNHVEYIYLSAGILFFDALCAIPFALLRQQEKSLRFAIIKNLNIFINISLNLYLLVIAPYWQSKGVWLPFYNPNLGITQIFIANIVASAFTFLLLIPNLNGIFSHIDRKLWKQLITYALPMLVVGFAGMINETMDRFFLRFFFTDIAVANTYNGIYAANYKLSIIITLFIQAFKYAAEPFFFAHAKTSDKRDIYAKVMDYFVWVCLSIFLLVTLFLPQFKLFIGQQFYEGLTVVPILLWANIFLGIYYNQSVWYKLSNQTGKGAQISLIGAAITIVLNIILVPKLNYVGCAITTLVCYASMMVFSYYWGKKYYPIPYNVSKFLLYSLLAVLLYGLNQILLSSFAANTYIQVSLGVIGLSIFWGIIMIKEKPLKLA